MAKRPGKTTGQHSPSRGTKRGSVLAEKPAGSGRLAKSADPAYVKFTTYIRRSTHLKTKTKLVSEEKELSDLVEQLLSDWLKQNHPVAGERIGA